MILKFCSKKYFKASLKLLILHRYSDIIKPRSFITCSILRKYFGFCRVKGQIQSTKENRILHVIPIESTYGFLNFFIFYKQVLSRGHDTSCEGLSQVQEAFMHYFENLYGFKIKYILQVKVKKKPTFCGKTTFALLCFLNACKNMLILSLKWNRLKKKGNINMKKI